MIHRQHTGAIKALSVEERGQLLTVLMEYQFEGIYPQNLHGSVLVAWKFIEPFVVEMNERYEATCVKNRKNGMKGADYGKLGGRPRKTSNGVSKTPKTPDKDND